MFLFLLINGNCYFRLLFFLKKTNYEYCSQFHYIKKPASVFFLNRTLIIMQYSKKQDTSLSKLKDQNFAYRLVVWHVQDLPRVANKHLLPKLQLYAYS
jgi:hypothetical protein